MFRFVFLFTALFTLNHSYSQQPDKWSRFDWSKCSASDFSDHFKEVYNFAVSEYKDDIYIGDYINKYAYFLASNLDQDVEMGLLYPNSTKDFSNYIKRVLRVIIKDTASLNKLKIYLHYDADMNASMDGSGILRINTGLFNYVKTEAELAGVLGHEFGHFINRDHNKRFSRSVTQGHSQMELLYSPIPWFSVQEESAADYLGIKYIKESPYTTSGLASVFKTFKRFEIKARIRYGNEVIINYTHPDPGERIKQVKMLIKDSLNRGRQNFVVDSAKFMQIKHMASQEAFNQMFEGCDFQNIVELSFYNYLFNPKDEDNLAVLIEGIRRTLSKNPLLENKQFIIYPYKTQAVKASANYKYINDDHSSILNHLNKGLIHVSSEDLRFIKAKDLLDSSRLEFITYKEALDYFIVKSHEINCSPCKTSEFLLNYKNAGFLPPAPSGRNTVFDCDDFIGSVNSPRGDLNGDLYVLLYPQFNEQYNFNLNYAEEYDSFVKSYKEIFKSTLGKNCFLISELPFKDQHLISGLLSCINDTVKVKQNSLPINMSVNWGDYAPELYQIFKKYKVANVYIQKIAIERKVKDPLAGDGFISHSYYCRISPSGNGKKNISAQLNKATTGGAPKILVESAAKQFRIFAESSNKLFN